MEYPNFSTDLALFHQLEYCRSLIKSEKHLRIANGKAQDLTIKKFIKNNPTIQEKFAELKNNSSIDY